jgi:hypothetical protein
MMHALMLAVYDRKGGMYTDDWRSILVAPLPKLTLELSIRLQVTAVRRQSTD